MTSEEKIFGVLTRDEFIDGIIYATAVAIISFFVSIISQYLLSSSR